MWSRSQGWETLSHFSDDPEEAVASPAPYPAPSAAQQVSREETKVTLSFQEIPQEVGSCVCSESPVHIKICERENVTRQWFCSPLELELLG